MEGKVRRVVTGHDKNGRAVVSSDGFAPSIFTNPIRPGQYSTEIWRTSGAPAPVGNEADPTTGPRQIKPPHNGTVIRITEFGPEPDAIRNMDPAGARKIFEEMGHADASTFDKGARHPLMHKTEGVDYALVLSGEIYLILDDADVLLKTGDVVVQRGTNHAWSNRSGKPCTMAFILVDGEYTPEVKAALKI